MTEQFKLKKAQQILKKETPILTKDMIGAVSEYRRNELENGVRNGKFKAPGLINEEEPKTTSAGYVVPGFSKKGFVGSTISDTTTGQGAGSWRGNGNLSLQNPELYSPLWLVSNLNFPRDRSTINAWSRAYYAMYPVVQNSISLHSTYPISKLNIKCQNPKVEKFFAEMIEELDLINICCQIAQEYWLLGEAYPYAELDEGRGKWSRILIQNPDYISVRHSVVGGEPLIGLRPDEQLKKICAGITPDDVKQRQQLNPAIVEYVRRGQDIPLDNLYVSQIARKIAPYEMRGTGLVVNCFKSLMLLDNIYEAHLAQSTDMINPITLVKVGSADYKPQPADLELWRQAFEQCFNNRNWKIFTHEAVTVERVGANSGILDTSNMEDRLFKNICIGLMVPTVIFDGGELSSYANGTVSLDVLKGRYLQFRNMMSAWLRRKIFAPIAHLNEFYDKVEGKNVLIVPEVDWNHMSLFDMNDYIQTMKELSTSEIPAVSKQALFRSLGLDFEEEKRKIRQEMIHSVILAKEKEALGNMSLNDLRALGANDVIQESTEPLPGQTQEGEEPGGLGSPPELPGVPPPPPPPTSGESPPSEPKK